MSESCPAVSHAYTFQVRGTIYDEKHAREQFTGVGRHVTPDSAKGAKAASNG